MFGKVGVIMTKEKIQAKLSNRVIIYLFVGCTENHSKYVYRMINLNTKSIIKSHDIIWLNKTEKEWKNDKTTIPVNEEQTIEIRTGIEKPKSNTNSTKG
jgi:hypothetical protein